MDIQNYINPELLILIPALMIIGKVLKEFNRLPSKYIPLILAILGGAGGIGICGLDINIFVQGMVVGLSGVGVHQSFKQINKEQ